MANSYATQQSWEQRPMSYSQGGLQPENEFGFSSLPVSSNGFDTSFSYSQSNPSGTPNVRGSSLRASGSGYEQTTTQFDSQKQSVPGAGPYRFFGTTSQTHESYPNYPNQQVPDATVYGSPTSYSPQAAVPTDPMSGLSIEDGGSLVYAVQQDLNTEPYLQTMHHQSYEGPIGNDTKRARTGESLDVQEEQEGKEGTRPRLGACHRCKSLKVKCEFKLEMDPCKRCYNGGHECFIPGRKKRRAPPKREFLLNQIRDQAAEIQKLMSMLETANKSTHGRPSTPDLYSPHLSPVSPHTEANGTRTPDYMTEDVAEWISKAKESLGVFGAHISMAGASMPRNLLAGNEQEADDEDDGYYTADGGDEDEFDIAVEDVDGEVPTSDLPATDRPVHRRESTSSLNSSKKRGDKKGVIIPTKASPFGLLGDLALNKYRGPRDDSESDEKEDKDATGIANENFFKPASTPANLGNRLADSNDVPHILSRGLITPAEAEALFKIYFDNMNLSLSILDPVLYTTPNTFVRSPFLFTVICAISSRFYDKRPDLYLPAMRYAQLAAGSALISGKKTVEMCHAFILLSLYPVPAKRWEDQRSWLYLGLALRVATELNLHLPVAAIPQEEKAAREILNRARVWLNCFNVDRSTSAQYGKPPTITAMDYQATHSQNWWRGSSYNMKNFDIHTCCYNHELRTTANFVAKIYNDPENPTGLNKNAEFEKLAAETDDQLQKIREDWFKVIDEYTDPNDYHNKFRKGLLKLAYSYGRLVVLSYGFQHAFGKNNTDENPFLTRCLNAAEDVLQVVVVEICGDPKMRVYWKHGPEAQSVFVTFASAFLVKLLQPKFASYLPYDKRVDIKNKVQEVIDLLSSIAVDNSHGPKLYAKFLKGLLASPMARLETQSPTTSIGSLPRQRTSRKPKTSAMPSSPNDASLNKDRASLSPPPHQDANSFDSFAPLRGASDPYAFGTDVASMSQNAIGLDMANIADLFNPPLSLDKQIIDSMQEIGDASSWTSYNWLSHYQSLQQNFGMDLKSDIVMQGEQSHFYS